MRKAGMGVIINMLVEGVGATVAEVVPLLPAVPAAPTRALRKLMGPLKEIQATAPLSSQR